MATRWFPDTCDCVVDIDGDKLTLVEPCAHHASAEAVLAENQQKNVEVVNPLIAEIGDGEMLPKGKVVEWQRNEKGTLDYKLVGFTEAEKLAAVAVITHEEIQVKDESDVVLKEAITKEEIPIEGEVIKGG